ncbi:MAG: FKBP-type peptidyl-prolyl cis-trans isomerase [Flavobacteriales bacterium]|nr:FKBP-type peptidyl-prolyl cis-trans isomerase [Flavobacteriales bacterium]
MAPAHMARCLHLKLVLGLVIILSWTCRPQRPEPVTPPSGNSSFSQSLRQELERENRRISETENEDIENYIRRRGWPFFSTGTGLRLAVYEKGQGRRPASGDIVWVQYSVSLLNGQECYRSEPGKVESFTVDFDMVESGLHEAMKYLREGDRAIVIIPSHLAFGLLGDLDKIPPFSTIVYDIYLSEVEPRKP